jgi:hypothetical protein
LTARFLLGETTTTTTSTSIWDYCIVLVYARRCGRQLDEARWGSRSCRRNCCIDYILQYIIVQENRIGDTSIMICRRHTEERYRQYKQWPQHIM